MSDKTIRDAIIYVTDLLAENDTVSLTLAANIMEHIQKNIEKGKRLDDKIVIE